MSKQHHSGRSRPLAATIAPSLSLVPKKPPPPRGGGNGSASPWQRRRAFSMFSLNRQLVWELTDAQKRNSFGTCQDKKIYPFFHAPDRLGNEHVPIKGHPSRGPGLYNHAEKDNILYHLSRRPQSTKGYILGARTTPRFGLTFKTLVPEPTIYQAIWGKAHMAKPAYAPFQSYAPRSPEHLLDKDFYPGPGTYDPYKMSHRHVTWPGKFGSPDWSLVPKPPKRTFKAELISDKAFKKNRNAMAYLSIYYD